MSRRAKPIEYELDANGCHVCTSHYRSKKGYPRSVYHDPRTGKGREAYISHQVYRAYHGPIPKGQVVRHTCDNRACINPAQLLAGSYRDNTRDACERGRMKATLTPERVTEIRTSNESLGVLAERFGVTRAAVCSAALGRTWTHVATPPRARRREAVTT